MCVSYQQIENPCKIAAKLVADGGVVGWFQGRMEFGQRALGSRSILADPRKPDMKDRVNIAVKFRERFRPFAPAILEERVLDYFIIPENTTVPYMEKAFPFRDDKKMEVPAVVHEDGTGRLQTVSRSLKPEFYEMISEFNKITGTPLVLNTSFNLAGDPIVSSPKEAVQTFYSSGITALVIGSFLLLKKKQQ
ncbi:MAG TPA: carbamoyltransferase C-terminal domain-containing protein, partial [Desulfobacterales bacterium]|nr:carbamoyltransferase C-terminal domain-containing protein [Desulfobacterales bacterium]